MNQLITQPSTHSPMHSLSLRHTHTQFLVIKSEKSEMRSSQPLRHLSSYSEFTAEAPYCLGALPTKCEHLKKTRRREDKKSESPAETLPSETCESLHLSVADLLQYILYIRSHPASEPPNPSRAPLWQLELELKCRTHQRRFHNQYALQLKQCQFS